MGEKENRRSSCAGERWNWRCDGSEEQANMRILHGHLRPWWCPARAAAKGHVWLHGPTEARVCVDVMACVTSKGRVDVHGLGCDLNPCWWPSVVPNRPCPPAHSSCRAELGRADSTPLGRVAALVRTWADQLRPRFRALSSPHPSIYPICELLMEPVLWSHSHKATAEHPPKHRSFGESSVLMV